MIGLVITWTVLAAMGASMVLVFLSSMRSRGNKQVDAYAQAAIERRLLRTDMCNALSLCRMSLCTSELPCQACCKCLRLCIKADRELGSHDTRSSLLAWRLGQPHESLWQPTGWTVDGKEIHGSHESAS